MGMKVGQKEEIKVREVTDKYRRKKRTLELRVTMKKSDEENVKKIMAYIWEVEYVFN